VTKIVAMRPHHPAGYDLLLDTEPRKKRNCELPMFKEQKCTFILSKILNEGHLELIRKGFIKKCFSINCTYSCNVFLGYYFILV
jgi:hypothetical protein